MGDEDSKELEDELARLDRMDHEPQIESDIDLALPSVPRMAMPVDQEKPEPSQTSLNERREVLLS